MPIHLFSSLKNVLSELQLVYNNAVLIENISITLITPLSLHIISNCVEDYLPPKWYKIYALNSCDFLHLAWLFKALKCTVKGKPVLQR